MQAPLTEVYIYDIDSGSWMTQKTTDILGGANYFYGLGISYGVGIPQKRYHMCAVAMSSPDKTSHNIYAISGTKDTDTPDDIWALTLPSAVWIRFNLSGTTNYPKAGGSCDPINGHCVHLAGGCYIAPGEPCSSYGWNPLLFDLSSGDWKLAFEAGARGYFVPHQIFSVIGGDALGHALHSSPIFTDFGDSALAQILGPPPDTGSASDGSVTYHQAPLKLLLPILLCSTFVFPVLVFPTKRFVNFLRYSVIKRPRSKRNWKPWALRTPYLVGLLTLTAFWISMVSILESVSSLPDPGPSHWTGGVDSDGHWSGSQFASVFIPASNSGKLPRGLVSFYVDTSSSGQWSRKNAVQRISVGIYVMWTYIPSIVGVLYGVLWMVVDGEIKRIEKYRQLSLPEGCKGKSSLCLDYHSFWAPLSIVQGVRCRQWTVVFSSTGFVLASIVVPNLQNYAFQWVLYSGATLTWGGTYSWQVGLVDPYWSSVLVVTLAMNLACLVGIMVVTATQDTGLSEDMLGLAGHAGLILDKKPSDLGFEVTDDEATFSKVCTKLFEQRFHISEENGCLTLGVNARMTYTKDSRIKVAAMKFLRQCRPTLFRGLPPLFRKIWKPFEFFLSRAGGVLLIADSWVTNCPHSFFFHPLPLSFWLLSLVLLLSATIYVLAQILQSSQTLLQNYSMPWSTNVYLVAGVLVQSFFDLLEHNVRSLAALDALRQGYCSPAVLWDDYTTGTPVAEVFSAFHRGQHLLDYVLLASFTSYIYTVMLGSLQVSASYCGSTTYGGDLAGVIIVLATNSFILAVSLAIAWRYGRATFLPRFPNVMASVLPYVLSSELLRRDLRAVRGKGRTGEKVKMLEDLDRRYAFGNFRNANEPPAVKHLGVERSYMDGPDARAHVSRRG